VSVVECRLSGVVSRERVVGCRLSGVGCWVSVVGCRLSGVGYRVSVVGCRLPGVGCRVSVVGCRLSVVVCRLSGVGCRVLVVGCRLSGAGCRVSVVGCRLSGVGYQHSALIKPSGPKKIRPFKKLLLFKMLIAIFTYELLNSSRLPPDVVSDLIEFSGVEFIYVLVFIRHNGKQIPRHPVSTFCIHRCETS
jgi:hypothetical protein